MFCLGVLEKDVLVYTAPLGEVEDCPLLRRNSAKSYQETKRKDYSSQRYWPGTQEGKEYPGQKTRARPGH